MDQSTRIQSEWSSQGLAKHICLVSKPMCRNYRTRFLAGRNRPATSFPLSDFRSSIDVPDNIVQNQPGSDLVLTILSGFGQTDQARKQASVQSVQESSGPLLANASQPIRTGCESDPACLLGKFILKSCYAPYSYAGIS